MSFKDIGFLLNAFTKNGKVDMEKIDKAKQSFSEEDKQLFNRLINNKEERERLFSSPEVQKIIEAMKQNKK